MQTAGMNMSEKLFLINNKGLRRRFHCKFAEKSTPEELLPEETLLWSQSLENLLKSKYGMTAFQTFLKSEFSYENIEFWLICEEYKKIKCSTRMSSRAKKIFKCYIEAEAPKEINIDHHTRDLIRQNVKTPNTSCFDEAQKIVYSLMEKDSYPRFLKSDVYQALHSSVSDCIKV
ncbi:regulator of G-protein signaling 13 isoform X2 [Denticeps clupeoides]|uniref:regulator of G-protein signaling 13 isoform X2 n=1 Tax=Denticeps clupeoides TaxID=299321 RepID=UPI0010A45BF3|nr:regulator of G-protein signaling 21-like isoform X2 [Denticeps clupeoides]